MFIRIRGTIYWSNRGKCNYKRIDKCKKYSFIKLFKCTNSRDLASSLKYFSAMENNSYYKTADFREYDIKTGKINLNIKNRHMIAIVAASS